MRKQHGQHNLDLTEIIFNNSGFNDWVVTTAFYSSVHFVEYALFPLIEDGFEYVTFNDYWDIKFRPKKVTKHGCKTKLVRTYLRSVSTQYRNLLDDCNTARYNDYNVNDLISLRAKMAATEIKTACLLIKA